MAGLLIGVILVPTSTFVNRHLLDAAPSGAVESLEFFDVAGTARLANDHAAFGAYDVSERDLDRCYSPIMWDTLPNRCADLWAGVRGTRFGGAGDTPAQPSLSRLWIDVVSRHPVAYLEHRLLAFNSMLYLYVPPHHTEYVRKLNTAANRSDRLSARVLDAIRYNWLMAPATLFAFGCSLLWFASREKRVPELERAAAIVLLVSATFYVLSFLPFGVATDMRYFLWPSMAVLLAAVILIPSLRRSFAARPLAALSLFSPVAAVLLLIAASRMSNALAALLI